MRHRASWDDGIEIQELQVKSEIKDGYTWQTRQPAKVVRHVDGSNSREFWLETVCKRCTGGISHRSAETGSTDLREQQVTENQQATHPLKPQRTPKFNASDSFCLRVIASILWILARPTKLSMFHQVIAANG